ncbi:MAG: hypothetical protein M1827_001702 [Pycnora praestabilis]|nr:MAG: hypothetical protein M1827_001702 [Pycnora praestabilis]
MVKPKTTYLGEDPFTIHQDESELDAVLEEEYRQKLKYEDEDSRSEQGSESSDDSNCIIDESVAEDIEKFAATFKGIEKRYRLINRIGEGLYDAPALIPFATANRRLLLTGTFSTVYKAEDLLYDRYDNEWDIEQKESRKWSSPPLKKRRTDLGPSSPSSEPFGRRKGPQYVAIKKIYVTSSPIRIQNELELLHDLKGCDSEYFRDFTVPDMRIYFRSLFTALAAVHKHHILHRDIKPTNFLYDIDRRRGVLVDFGLAEEQREGTECSPCLCQDPPSERREKASNSFAAKQSPATGCPKNDSRPSRRANRAGTRGFRAPEVLLKCTSQTISRSNRPRTSSQLAQNLICPEIDIWSVGVILLTILSRRFPFFNSTDDIEALIEIATIFGTRKMKACALLHGAIFESSIPTIGERGFSLEKIVLWSTGRTEKDSEGRSEGLGREEAKAVAFMQRCFELDPSKRIGAEEALKHEFLAGAGEDAAEEDEIEML